MNDLFLPDTINLCISVLPIYFFNSFLNNPQKVVFFSFKYSLYCSLAFRYWIQYWCPVRFYNLCLFCHFLYQSIYSKSSLPQFLFLFYPFLTVTIFLKIFFRFNIYFLLSPLSTFYPTKVSFHLLLDCNSLSISNKYTTVMLSQLFLLIIVYGRHHQLVNFYSFVFLSKFSSRNDIL